MAVRRINFTGRKRLKRTDARVYLYPSDVGPAEFDLNLKLDAYGLPADACVSVEAYRQTSWMRFSCGTVADTRLPDYRRLVEFGSTEAVLFRVRVTSTAAPEGLLLAEADRIQPRAADEIDEDRLPLLPVVPSDDLRDEIVRIDFTDSPKLLINTRVGDWRSVARSPVFISLTYPAVMRDVLTRALHIDNDFGRDDLSEWQAQWLQFCVRLPGVAEAPAGDEELDKIDDWIEDAVAAFARKNRILKKFATYWVRGEST